MNSLENMFSGGAYQGYTNAGDTIANTGANYSNLINPYIQAGTSSLPQYQNLINQMSNPGQYISKLMQGYTMTPQAQYALQQGERGANAAAAAGGMAGSGAEQKELQRMGQQITEQDQQQYLNNRLGVMQQAMGGLNNLIGSGEKGANKYGSIMSKLADAGAQSQIGQSEAGEQGKMGAIGNGLGLAEHFL